MKRRTLLTMGGVAGLFAVTGIGLSLQSTKPWTREAGRKQTIRPTVANLSSGDLLGRAYSTVTADQIHYTYYSPDLS